MTEKFTRYRQPPKPEKRRAMQELLDQDVPLDKIARRLGYKSRQSVITTMNKWGLAAHYSKSRAVTPARANELADRLERRATEIMADAKRWRERATELSNSSRQPEEAPRHVSNDGTQVRAAGVAPGPRGSLSGGQGSTGSTAV